MKLIYKVLLTFIVPLVVTLGLWGWFSYRTMSDKISSDYDKILTDYAEGIVARKLSGEQLPERFNGVHNTYILREVASEYALSRPAISFSDSDAHLFGQEDLADSRLRTQIFHDGQGRYFELTVSLPTFEQDVLVHHVLGWTLLLFAVLLVSLIVISLSVLNYNLRPFHELLNWIGEYVPGKENSPVPDVSDVDEYHLLAVAVKDAVERIESQYEDRKVFIGNVSHELQTPLASCINRLEMLLGRPDLDEGLAEELVKMLRSLQGLSRMNRTLLLLTRIENGQFPEKEIVDFNDAFNEAVQLYSDMYGHKDISCDIVTNDVFMHQMNAQMASVLVNNILKNAFVHSPASSVVYIHIDAQGFVVRNRGEKALDASRIFRRFYLPEGRKEGSSGLGLSLVYAVCRHSGLEIVYSFSEGYHEFAVNLKN